MTSNSLLESKIRRIVRRQLNEEENTLSLLEDNKDELERILSKLTGEKIQVTFKQDGKYIELYSNYLPVKETFFAPAFKQVRIEALGQLFKEKNIYGFNHISLSASYESGGSNGFSILNGLWFDIKQNKWIVRKF